MKLKIKVIPGSSRNKILGWLGDNLKVAVTAPPQAGKANKAVIELFAKTLKIEKKTIEITSGQTSFRKVIEFKIKDENKILEKLNLVCKHKYSSSRKTDINKLM